MERQALRAFAMRCAFVMPCRALLTEGNEANEGLSKAAVAHPRYNRSSFTDNNFFSAEWAGVVEQDAAWA
jgi:hypothetical protein